jgi:hypothetical protein
MSRKHKHRKHKGCCSGQNQHQCGKNCQCNEVDRVEISTEAELHALLNLIMKHGKEREERQLKKDIDLANAMLADVESDVSTNPVALLTNGETKV